MKVTLIVGTVKGGFRFTSKDRRTWRIEEPLFKGWKVTTSARSPAGRWFLGTSSFVYGAAIHVSDDGVKWRQIEKEQAPSYPDGGIHKLTQIWTIQADEDRCLAGVDTAGLFQSNDHGESWQPVSALNDHETRPKWYPGNGGLCAHTILTDARNPDRIWCGISAVGAWRSDDGGASWKLKNDGIRCVIEDKDEKDIGYCVHAMVQDPEDADTIYRQDHTGMYRTKNAGDSWEKIDIGLASWFGFPIAMDPKTKTLFSFPMESDEYRMPVDGKFRVYRSAAGGESWEALGEGLPSEPNYSGVLRGAMAVDALDPCGVYIGSTDGRVYASADLGDTWQALPATLPRVLSVRAYAEE